MPLSNRIAEQIYAYSASNKSNEIVSYLKEKIEKSEASVRDIFDYVRDYYFSDMKGEPYVVNENIINLLGVMVSKLEGNEQRKFAGLFYKLAADRNSSIGCRNYALCLLKGRKDCNIQKSAKDALIFVRKAIDLAKEIPAEQNKFKLLLCIALRENRKYIEANIVLMDYFSFKSNQVKFENDPALKAKIETEVSEVIELCKTILDEFEIDINKDVDDLSVEKWRSKLEEIDPLLNCKVDSNEFIIIQHHAYFHKAKYHEHLEEYSIAMGMYCVLSDKTLPIYSKVILARSNLLKKQVDTQLVSALLPTMQNMNINADNKSQVTKESKQSPELNMAHDVSLPSKFGSKWKADTIWYHSANEKGIATEFETSMKQIEQLITARKTELSEIEISLKEATDIESLKLRKNVLEEELKTLRDLKRKLKQNHQEYLPFNRKVFRRHAAETHFFNPKRSKKSKELVALTAKLIDQRYRTDDVNPNPVNLKGISSRLYITAERAFQEAAIALTGQQTPKLGIPTARVRPWSFGRGGTGYGPVERYQIGETTVTAEHRTSPKRERLGDSYLPQHGTYSGVIYPFLFKLAEDNIEKEKQLANYMIRYGKKHQSVSLEELQVVYTEASNSDVDNFNRICFLIMDKEQAQWHSATDKRFHIGMSVAQARCLLMIKAGFINFEEAFKNNTLFGIYSNTGLIDNPGKVALSCKNIDDLYLTYLQNKHAQDHFKFLKSHITNSSPPVCVMTREQSHLDLKEVYGGDADTDNEGYDTDLSM